MQQPEAKFGEWIEGAFTLYKENLVVLLVIGLITMVLGSLTLGVLAGPLMVGMNLVVLRLIDKSEPAPQIGDLFKGFDFFLNAFLFILIYGVVMFAIVAILAQVPCLGPVLSTIVPIVINAFLMFVLFLIPDQGLAFWPAVLASIDRVKQNFWPLLGLNVVAGLLSAVGAIACGIGIILTYPMYACIVGCAYRDCFGGQAEEDAPVVEVPPVVEIAAAAPAATPAEEETVEDPEGEDGTA